jgi:hypothetical protein
MMQFRGAVAKTVTTTPPYQCLDADKISQTIERLSARISERFPESGLRSVCGHLLVVSQRAKTQTHAIEKPHIWLRILAFVLIFGIVTALLWSFTLLKKPQNGFDTAQFIQLLEAAINDVILIGAAIFFLASLETRVKRQRALKALHELRALAHIVDMHQLTKDPERTISGRNVTASSPTTRMAASDLERYLDYCSEMLSLIGKIAALYIQNFDDGVALAAVNEIESLTTGLSSKIWQKIIIIHEMKA